MSIADVSKTMSDLAAAINKKNAELEALRAQYTHNLNVVQKYLAAVSTSDILQSADDFVALVDSPVTCRQCGYTLHDISKDADYVLVPRRGVMVQESANENGDKRDEQNNRNKEQQQSNENLKHSQADTSLRKNTSTKGNTELSSENHKGANRPAHHSRTPSKRTCSYCGKPGHSRSRCFSRLSKEPGSAK